MTGDIPTFPPFTTFASDFDTFRIPSVVTFEDIIRTEEKRQKLGELLVSWSDQIYDYADELSSDYPSLRGTSKPFTVDEMTSKILEIVG